MKNEKLELLLNKVVEFNQSQVNHYKGFLYKDKNGYYIKVVETIFGQYQHNDIVRLVDDAEQYIVHAEKPKLMRVSMKSWHYRLVKYVLRSNAPTKENMQNGCPYFWLLIFSLVTSPFIVFGKLLWDLLLLFPRLSFKILEKMVESMIPDMDDMQAFEYYNYGRNSMFYKLPITAKIYFEKSDTDFLDYFLLEKYNLDKNITPDEYTNKTQELAKKWKLWRAEIVKANKAKEAELAAKILQISKKRKALELKQAEHKARWDARMKPIKALFTFTGDYKKIIKRTKQIVGALITIGLLVATYFFINFLAYGIIATTDWCIDNWLWFAAFGIVFLIAGIVYIAYILLKGLVQSLINKYKAGRKIWYVQPFIYLLYYPIKYFVLGFAYTLYYILWIPVKYFSYDFFWKVVCMFIWGVIRSIGRGLVNSTGIFGEYFDASYTDYCPGIEWVDTEEEEVK